MNSAINSNGETIVYIDIIDSDQSSNNNSELSNRIPEVEYSYQDNLIHFDFDTGLMTHDYSDGTTRYKGEWLDGYPNGNGTMYYKDGSIAFEGKWVNGVFEVDSCHRYFYKENRMEVRYKDGKLWYKGEWNRGVPDGEGEYFLKNGQSFLKGKWKNGLYEIKKDIFFEYSCGGYVHKKNNHVIYRGEMNEDYDYHGKGKKYNENDKLVYNGEWKNGCRYGLGRIYEKNQLVYDGELHNAKFYGKGKKYENGQLVYEGEWENGIPYGKGVYYENGKKKYKGRWVKGRINIHGNKWFIFANRKTETLLPMKEENIYKFSYKLKSVDSLNDKWASLISRIKCASWILGCILILILAVLLYHGFSLFFSKTVTVHNLYEFILVKPFVNDLTIEEGCGNSWKGGLKLSGYNNLKSLTIHKSSFQNVKSLEISKNPMLETICINKNYETPAFQNLDGFVVFQSNEYLFINTRSSFIERSIYWKQFLHKGKSTCFSKQSQLNMNYYKIFLLSHQ